MAAAGSRWGDAQVSPGLHTLRCYRQAVGARQDAINRLGVRIGVCKHPGLRISGARPDGVPGKAVRAELSRFVASLGIDAEQTGQTYDVLMRGLLTSA